MEIEAPTQAVQSYAVAPGVWSVPSCQAVPADAAWPAR